MKKTLLVTFSADVMAKLGIRPMNRDKTLYGSSSMSVEVLPSGKLDLFETPLIAISDRPQWMVCDCCLQHVDRLWIWAQRGFCTRYGPGGGRLEYKAGGWSFCVYCHALRTELELLVARVVTLNKEMDPAAARGTYTVMLACLYGEPVEWKSGEPRVRADELLRRKPS